MAPRGSFRRGHADRDPASVGRPGGDRFALTGPAAITLRDGGAVIDGLSIAAGAGRITAAGRVGQALDLRVAIRFATLSLARIAAPSLAPFRGPWTAKPISTGLSRAPRTLRDQRREARRPADAQAGLPAIDATAKGTLSDGQRPGRRDGRARRRPDGLGIAAREAGGPLDLRARGTLDASLANSLLSVGGQSVTGKVTIDGASPVRWRRRGRRARRC